MSVQDLAYTKKTTMTVNKDFITRNFLITATNAEEMAKISIRSTMKEISVEKMIQLHNDNFFFFFFHISSCESDIG